MAPEASKLLCNLIGLLLNSPNRSIAMAYFVKGKFFLGLITKPDERELLGDLPL
jgi:hypothetical protein